MDFWKIFPSPHLPQISQEDKGDIQDFGLDVVFCKEKWNFPLCEPRYRGTLRVWKKFSPTHPIPIKFPRKIREIFKIRWWMWDFHGRNRNFLNVNLRTRG